MLMYSVCKLVSLNILMICFLPKYSVAFFFQNLFTFRPVYLWINWVYTNIKLIVIFSIKNFLVIQFLLYIFIIVPSHYNTFTNFLFCISSFIFNTFIIFLYIYIPIDEISPIHQVSLFMVKVNDIIYLHTQKKSLYFLELENLVKGR